MQLTMLRNRGSSTNSPNGPQSPLEPAPSAARIEAHSFTKVDEAWFAFHHRHLPLGLTRYTTFELAFALRHRQSFEIAPDVFNKLPAFQMRLIRVGTNTARSNPWAAIIAKYAKRFSPRPFFERATDSLPAESVRRFGLAVPAEDPRLK